MGKFKMPTVQEFLDKKTIYGPKKEPVWVSLERENVGKLPYNEKVGAWLRFLKELTYYFYCEAKRKEKRITTEAGPAWYCELSSTQREVLYDLKTNIHQDLLEDLPNRTRKSLSDLGITLKISKSLLMQAMIECVEDPGVFIWNLYKAIYKISPSQLRGRYDMNAMILMSSLVFIDLEECVEMLEKLTQKRKSPPCTPKKKSLKNFQPDVRYGEYLQQCYVPFYSNRSSGTKKKTEPGDLDYKFRLRSQESYERICKNHAFIAINRNSTCKFYNQFKNITVGCELTLRPVCKPVRLIFSCMYQIQLKLVSASKLEKRKERNKKEKQVERVCTYKFWEPPSSLRNTDPRLVALANKLKMIKRKAKPKHKAQYQNMQYHVGGVAFTGGKPHYILTNVALLPTGYIPINGGIINVRGQSITCILGYWKFPKEGKEKCNESCDCLAKWEETLLDYIEKTKCKCGHFYDFKNEGKNKEKYFYPASRSGPLWIDQAKIYQMDPVEDFIKDTVKDALISHEPTPEPSLPTISASALTEKELLAALLADLSDTPLLIPHLPQANLLNNLQEWVRNKVKGKILPQLHKRFLLQSQRRWLDLKHMEFRARAYMIPFTLKQLEHMNWSHRHLVQKLFKILLEDFVSRNRLKQVEQTRLWWSTTKYDAYPSKAFLDIFFTYMPGRMKDTFLINPYSSERTQKYGAKTCPL